MFWFVFDPRNVPIPTDVWPLLKYTNGSPFSKLCALLNSIKSLIWSIPPRIFFNRPSKTISLFLFVTIGFKIAPEPFPPDIVTDKTFSTSKSCWSTNISSREPVITGCTSAVVPVPADGTWIVGGFTTSKFTPWFKISIFERGP